MSAHDDHLGAAERDPLLLTGKEFYEGYVKPAMAHALSELYAGRPEPFNEIARLVWPELPTVGVKKQGKPKR